MLHPLIYIQYFQTVVFSIGKGLDGQNHFSCNSTLQWINYPSKISTGGIFRLAPNDFSKTLCIGRSAVRKACMFQVINFLEKGHISKDQANIVKSYNKMWRHTKQPAQELQEKFTLVLRFLSFIKDYKKEE